MTLKDTLSRFREQESRAKQDMQDKPKVLEDWTQAIAGLLASIRNALAEYEKDGSLSFYEDTVELSEEDLGSYQVPTLKINAAQASILVQPVGRLISKH